MSFPLSPASGSSSSQSVCTWWLRGCCRFGDSCTRLHGKDTNKTSHQRDHHNRSDLDYRRPSGFSLSTVPARVKGEIWRSKDHEYRDMGYDTNHGSSRSSAYNFPMRAPICRYWRAGNCAKGEQCQFSHNPETGASQVVLSQNMKTAPETAKEEAEEAASGGSWRHRTTGSQKENGAVESESLDTFPSTQTAVCKYWEAGNCARGEQCRFLHDPEITAADVYQVAIHEKLEAALEKANQEYKRSIEFEKAARQAREGAEQEIQYQQEALAVTLESIEEHYKERRAQFDALIHGEVPAAERQHHAFSMEKAKQRYKLWLAQETVAYEGRVAEARENHALALEEANKEYNRRLAEEATAIEASEIAARERQRQLQALRRAEAEVTEQYAVLGESSLITCRAGIEVESVITGFDICRIIIRNLPRDTKHEDVSEILVHYGMASSDFFVLNFRIKDKVNRREATVLVTTDYGREIAVGLEDTEFRGHTLTFEVSESPNGNAMGSSPGSVLSICWRVPHTTIIATYKNMGEAERKARALNGNVCKGQRIRAEKNQWLSSSVKLTGFPLGTSVDRQIYIFAGTKDVKAMVSKSCTLEESFAMLLDHLHDFPNVKTNIHNLVPGPINGKVRVKAYFDSWKDAKRAHDSLNGKQLESDSPMFRTSLPSPLQYKTIVPLQQYEAQKRKWDALFEISGSDAQVQINTVEDQKVVFICVVGQDKKVVGSLKVRVEGMIAGERLDPKFWHPSFLLPSGKAFFERIYKDKKVYVRSDSKVRVLRLYGEAEASEEVRQMIKEEIDSLARLETTVILDQESIGFFMREGLGRLRELVGEENVNLNFMFGQCEITIKGGEEDKHHLYRLIKESQTARTMGQIRPEKEEKETCPICYDEVSHPEQLGCGHTYCSGCLRHYLASAPETKTFPLVCLGHETACKIPIPLPLIRRFLTPQAFQALVEAAFRLYLDQHAQELKYCTTPDCQQIYRHNSKARILQCPSCFSSICSACDEEAHEGLTCQESRDQKDTSKQDRLFNEWANEHGKRCPECRSVIEKSGGCNHITCRCGAHFCWKCGKTFSSNEIYQHMNSVHGGIDDENPIPGDDIEEQIRLLAEARRNIVFIFTQVFTTLPPEAQQKFVEKHLTGLLDIIPKEKSRKILSAVTRVQAKYKDVPKLDLRAKRKEITWLLDELAKDSKTSFIKERSNRSEIIEEIIDSLVDWLNDIWAVVYEHNINFNLAHACLLFIAEVLAQLSGSTAMGGCKCLVMNLPIYVTIKDNNGKTVKHMSVLGPQNIDRVLLWIWRDLFVSLFSKGSKRERDKIPEMLEDVESLLGIDGLERLLYGGEKDDDYGEDDDEGSLSEDDSFDDESCIDDDSDGDEYGRCRCHFHAKHWPEYINRARIPLRECVERRLTHIFETTPSLRLYNTLLSISHNVFKTESQLLKKLPEIAGSTPDNLVAALDINIFICDEEVVASLLESHAYLLRPRDAATLQCAVSILDDSEYQSKSFAILEKELEDSMRAIYATLRSCFSHIEEESNKKELLEILRLPPKSSTRKERLEQWSEQIITSSTIHPMAMAAVLMGLPMFPGADEGEDVDFLNYVDLDQSDPDLDDLREEYQPNLKQRFDGWVQLAQGGITGGPTLLTKLYLKAIDLMPWLRGPDATSEMISRLRERPNKAHLVDALVNLNSFAKSQRKKQKSSATSASSSTVTPNASSTSSPSVPAPSSPFSFGPPPTNVNGTPPPLPFPFSVFPRVMED